MKLLNCKLLLILDDTTFILLENNQNNKKKLILMKKEENKNSHFMQLIDELEIKNKYFYTICKLPDPEYKFIFFLRNNKNLFKSGINQDEYEDEVYDEDSEEDSDDIIDENIHKKNDNIYNIYSVEYKNNLRIN